VGSPAGRLAGELENASKKTRRGAAFGAAGSFVCVDAGNVCRSHVWMNATPWARRKFNNLGVDGVLVVSTRLGVTAGYGLGQARNLPGHYVEVGDL
jgi:hypothetical protein